MSRKPLHNVTVNSLSSNVLDADPCLLILGCTTLLKHYRSVLVDISGYSPAGYFRAVPYFNLRRVMKRAMFFNTKVITEQTDANVFPVCNTSGDVSDSPF